MRPEEGDAAYLWHMLEAARRIQLYVAGLDLEHYQTDQQLQESVERALEIIGEAARRVSDTFRKAHPEIPWSQIIRQRNVIAHFYYGLRHELIWESATAGVEDLISRLEAFLPSPPPDPEPR